MLLTHEVIQKLLIFVLKSDSFTEEEQLEILHLLMGRETDDESKTPPLWGKATPIVPKLIKPHKKHPYTLGKHLRKKNGDIFYKGSGPLRLQTALARLKHGLSPLNPGETLDNASLKLLNQLAHGKKVPSIKSIKSVHPTHTKRRSDIVIPGLPKIDYTSAESRRAYSRAHHARLLKEGFVRGYHNGKRVWFMNGKVTRPRDYFAALKHSTKHAPVKVKKLPYIAPTSDEAPTILKKGKVDTKSHIIIDPRLLKDAIRNSGRTIPVIAKEAGISWRTIYGWISKPYRTPSIEYLSKLCMALGIKPSSIMPVGDTIPIK